MANGIHRKEETQKDYTKIGVVGMVGMVGSAYPKAGIGEEAKREKRRTTQDEENKHIGPFLPKKFTVSPNSLALRKQRQERASTRERESRERHRKVFRNTTVTTRTGTNNNKKHNKNLRQGTEATNPQKTPKSAEAIYPLCLCLCLSLKING
jgi:hypothetical protein